MAHDATSPVTDQEAFRGRDDDQTLNSATFDHALNGNFTQNVNTAFRIRYEVQETAGGATGNQQYSLEYNKNGTGWNDVTLSSSNVQIENSGQYTNGDATTQVIGDGSFVAGDGVEDPGTASGNIDLTSESTEIEYCLTIVSGDVSDADTIDIRVKGLDGYTNTPTVTVNKGTNYNQSVGGALSFSGGVSSVNVGKLVGGSLSFVGSISKGIGKLLAGVLSFVGSISKGIGKLLAGVLSFVGSLGTVHTPAGGGRATAGQLTNGPWITHATDTTTRVWFQLDGDGDVDLAINGATFSTSVDSTTNFCGYIEATGLSASTKYSYSLTVEATAVPGSWNTRTYPTADQPGSFLLVQASDYHIRKEEYQDTASMISDIDDKMAVLWPMLQNWDHLPRLYVTNGDHEIPGEHEASSDEVAARRTEHQRQRGLNMPNRAALHAELPAYFTWDDHDYLGNNSAGAEELVSARDAARQVTDEMYLGHPTWTDAKAIFCAFTVADCLVMLLDNRSNKDGSPGTDPRIEVDPSVTALNGWGATQLQWIKDTLTANASKKLKFIFNGCSLVDPWRAHKRTPPGNKRDSMSLYHRQERNDLMAWLRDNPAAAAGTIWFKGDDHHAAVHRQQNFRLPEPYTHPVTPPFPGVNGYTPAESWPTIPGHDLIQLCSSFNRNDSAGGIPNPAGEDWHGSPHEIMSANRFCVWIVEVRTDSNPPTARFRLFDLETGVTFYQMGWTDGEFYTPRSDYRSWSDVERSTNGAGTSGFYTPSQYTPDSGPSSSWTPDPGPP